MKSRLKHRSNMKQPSVHKQISSPFASNVSSSQNSSKRKSLRALLSLHNFVIISMLYSHNQVTAETYIALNKAINDTLEPKSSSLEAASFTSQYSKCNDPCLFVNDYSLQPLTQTNCHQYVVCQDNEETYRFTCPDGQLFDNSKKKCVSEEIECKCSLDTDDGGTLYSAEAEAICSFNKGNVANQYPLKRCKEYVSCRRSGKVKGMNSCREGFLFDELLGACNVKDRVKCRMSTVAMTESSFNDISFGNLNTNSGAQSNEGSMKEQYEIAELYEIYCAASVDSDSMVIPLPECKEYVTCSRGEVFQTHSCADGLIFDVSLGGCNWNYMAECTVTYPPSKSPTQQPTPAPTTSPTEQPITPSPGEGGLPFILPKTFPPFSESPTSSDVFPKLLEWIEERVTPLNEKVFRSYSPNGLSYRSYWFEYSDFMKALRLMSGESITGNKKHKFYLGNQPSEWEYGLVNVAAFLGQAMTESISKDACDEYNWEMNTDDFSNGKVTATVVKGDQHYATSNACGQGGLNYQEYHCDAEESHMECAVDRNMKIQATTSEVYPNAPPPLTCRPRTISDSFTGFWDVITGKESAAFPYENSFGRTDVEGCCFWGRGAIHTKGICNLGKLNYYLGKQAANDGRPSRYPDVDFCGFPEAICAGPDSPEMRWVTSMFEWTERVQSYDDGKGWNYISQLKKFVDTGLYDMDFVKAVSGIVTHGCHEPPCRGATSSINGGLGSTTEIRAVEDRERNFQTVLLALDAGGKKAMIRALTNFLLDYKEIMNKKILQSQTPEGQLYPSYRYQLSDLLSALTKISEDGVAEKKFYIGEVDSPMGVRYGVVNVVMFLAQSYKEAIQYDACDENNWSMVNDKFPLSNSCGQLDMSYQDMHCEEEEAHMECPVKLDMEQYALTSALWFQAPGPFRCGPKSKFPITGYWDYDLGKENNEDAYANDRGRVDVEGCCWWGRGIIQTRGVCSYGKLNYYLGARAAREGRKSLYPNIDFCDFPQGVCSSDETYGGELQWMVGLFEWVERIQPYDRDGWNYIDELKAFADGGYTDFEFVDRVSSILNLGCHSPPCNGISTASEPHNQRERNDVFQRFLNQLRVVYNFPAPPPPTPLPTPFPTEEPTIAVPTTDSPVAPTVSPTISSQPTSLAGRVPRQVAVAFIKKVALTQKHFQEAILLSQYPYGTFPSYLYTWRSFLVALEKMTMDVVGPGPGNWFYIGEENAADYGLVNLAAFLAYGVTQSIHHDSCDENNWELVDFRYPLSNSCGQGLEGGLLYQEQVCTDEDQGLECEVDDKMEINGVTHASWIGAPRPMYCGDKLTGYWDHLTGLERNDTPFKSAAGRTDVRGCCWWGRGVLQVRGVCQYGKLNYYLGAKGALVNRETMYPDIDFCKNPGAICSDRRAPELRWVTGMFYWANQVQRNRMGLDYMEVLKDYVNARDFEASSFIDTLNLALGGNFDIKSNRTQIFFEALKGFGLIEVEEELDEVAVNATASVYNKTDASSNFTIIEKDQSNNTDMMVSEEALGTNDTDTQEINKTLVEMTALLIAPETSKEVTIPQSTNYCGDTWTNAASTCALACPSGMDAECPPSQFCFAEVDCTQNAPSIRTNWCGKDWNDAQVQCMTSCPAGLDSECPPPTRCFADITTCSE